MEETIINLFKKGDKLNMDNFRGICLLNVTGKIFNLCIQSKLSEFYENNNIFHSSQNDFIPKRSCKQHVFALTEMLQFRKKNKLNTYVFYLDLRKTFDRVPRKFIYVVMESDDVDLKTIRVIHRLHELTKLCVKLRGEYSNFFETSRGVPQGDDLSLFLFDVLLNVILKRIAKSDNVLRFGGRAAVYASVAVGTPLLLHA